MLYSTSNINASCSEACHISDRAKSDFCMLHLHNINNTRPIFNKVNYSTTLLKMMLMNSKIALLTTISLDSGNIISYRNQNYTFKIYLTSGIVKIVYNAIWANFSEITLNVTATDGVHLSEIIQFNIRLTSSETGTVISRCSSSICNSDKNNFGCKGTGMIKKLKACNNFK